MSWDPNVKSPVHLETDINCAICLEEIVPEDQAPCEEEKPRALDCSHIFHRECIGSWLVRQQNCPLCKTVVKVDTPAVIEQEDTKGRLFVIRQNVLETRKVRRLNLNENTSVATATAKKVNSFVSNFFGWDQ